MVDESDGKKIELNLAEKCPKELLEKFVHKVLDSICSGKEPRYASYGKVWNIEEWSQVLPSVGATLKGFVTRGLTKKQISDELDACVLKSESKQVILDCLLPRYDEVRAALVATTAGITSAQLKDFDWKLKMVLASDKLASIRKPLVTIDFDIRRSDSDQHVSVELSQEELHSVITSLEAANKVIVQLKS